MPSIHSEGHDNESGAWETGLLAYIENPPSNLRSDVLPVLLQLAQNIKRGTSKVSAGRSKPDACGFSQACGKSNPNDDDAPRPESADRRSEEKRNNFEAFIQKRDAIDLAAGQTTDTMMDLSSKPRFVPPSRAPHGQRTDGTPDGSALKTPRRGGKSSRYFNSPYLQALRRPARGNVSPKLKSSDEGLTDTISPAKESAMISEYLHSTPASVPGSVVKNSEGISTPGESAKKVKSRSASTTGTVYNPYVHKLAVSAAHISASSTRSHVHRSGSRLSNTLPAKVTRSGEASDATRTESSTRARIRRDANVNTFKKNAGTGTYVRGAGATLGASGLVPAMQNKGNRERGVETPPATMNNSSDAFGVIKSASNDLVLAPFPTSNSAGARQNKKRGRGNVLDFPSPDNRARKTVPMQNNLSGGRPDAAGRSTKRASSIPAGFSRTRRTGPPKSGKQRKANLPTKADLLRSQKRLIEETKKCLEAQGVFLKKALAISSAVSSPKC